MTSVKHGTLKPEVSDRGGAVGITINIHSGTIQKRRNNPVRITEDNHTVKGNELVYEIMYRYYNPEVSLPEPEQRAVRLIPEDRPIWLHRQNCQIECDRIIKRMSK